MTKTVKCTYPLEQALGFAASALLVVVAAAAYALPPASAV